MITLHHLERSRSHRILWLLEELEIPYELKVYERDSKTMLAPDTLKKIHPLGKSPVITDDSLTIAESGAIVEYLVSTYGGDKLKPAEGTEAFNSYRYFLHAAEGSFMPYLFLSFVMHKLTQPPVPIVIRPIAKALEYGLKKQLLEPNFKTQFEFLEKTLDDKEWLCGADFTAADIHMSYVIISAESRGDLKPYPNVRRFLENIRSRPALKKTISIGGPVQLN